MTASCETFPPQNTLCTLQDLLRKNLDLATPQICCQTSNHGSPACPIASSMSPLYLPVLLTHPLHGRQQHQRWRGSQHPGPPPHSSPNMGGLSTLSFGYLTIPLSTSYLGLHELLGPPTGPPPHLPPPTHTNTPTPPTHTPSHPTHPPSHQPMGRLRAYLRSSLLPVALSQLKLQSCCTTW